MLLKIKKMLEFKIFGNHKKQKSLWTETMANKHFFEQDSVLNNKYKTKISEITQQSNDWSVFENRRNSFKFNTNDSLNDTSY